MIARIAARVPFDALCLPQAMTGRWVLARRGIPSRVVIGSRCDDEAELHYHAWLMVEDRCVTGARERELFSAFRREARVAESRS
jgi:hypothetical protein